MTSKSLTEEEEKDEKDLIKQDHNAVLNAVLGKEVTIKFGRQAIKEDDSKVSRSMSHDRVDQKKSKRQKTLLDDDDYEFAGKLDRDMQHRLGSNLAFVSGLQSNTFKNG